MDKRLTRGIILAVAGGALVWFGKGITEYTDENKLMGNAMLVSLVIGFYAVVLALCSLYDFAINPEKHD